MDEPGRIHSMSEREAMFNEMINRMEQRALARIDANYRFRCYQEKRRRLWKKRRLERLFKRVQAQKKKKTKSILAPPPSPSRPSPPSSPREEVDDPYAAWKGYGIWV
jgi:hypothetical protein